MWIACALLEKNSRFGGQGHQGPAQLPLLPMLHLCAAYEYIWIHVRYISKQSLTAQVQSCLHSQEVWRSAGVSATPSCRWVFWRVSVQLVSTAPQYHSVPLSTTQYHSVTLSTTQYHSVPLSTSATWSKVVRLAHWPAANQWGTRGSYIVTTECSSRAQFVGICEDHVGIILFCGHASNSSGEIDRHVILFDSVFVAGFPSVWHRWLGTFGWAWVQKHAAWISLATLFFCPVVLRYSEMVSAESLMLQKRGQGPRNDDLEAFSGSWQLQWAMEWKG